MSLPWLLIGHDVFQFGVNWREFFRQYMISVTCACGLSKKSLEYIVLWDWVKKDIQLHFLFRTIFYVRLTSWWTSNVTGIMINEPDHPWLREDGEASDKPIDSAVLVRMKQFRAMNKLKKLALKV